MNRFLHAARLRHGFRLMVLLALAFAALGRPQLAHALTPSISVDTPVDETTTNSNCSLREAIGNVNAAGQPYADCGTGSGVTSITFFDNYTITLGSTLTISHDMTITGNGVDNTIIQASACDPTAASCATNYSVFSVTAGTVSLNEMTIQHGQQLAGFVGAGISNSGGTLTVDHALISHNKAGYGGGIGTDSGYTTTLNHSTVDGNQYTYEGGGVFNQGTTNVYNSTFSNNAKVGTTYGGGGLTNQGTATIANSTFAFNTAASGYAVIHNWTGGVLTIDNTTVAMNTGTGVYNDAGATLNVSNSIMTGSAGEYGCIGGISGVTADHNIIVNTYGNSCGIPVSSADPRLRTLADNGGPTKTMALITGSPAIEAGNQTTCTNAPVSGVDQRGVSRGNPCDIGAYEGEVPRTPSDFQGHGVSNPAKYVPAAGAVYYYQPSGSAFIGTDGDYVLNSDFDGDGKTDPAKYVAAAGAIWYLGSADTSWHGVYIGSDGDFIPASDFDGDGKTDPAKYVAAAGAVWYYGSADSTWYGVYIGSLNGGDYVPGSDFDGDGKTDPAHTDSSGNVWYLGSADSTLYGHFIGADGPYVPRSDYDGDGKTDPAKFASGNIWYLQSNNSYDLSSLALGGGPEFVVPGSDFDGDGITDPAWFASDAMWWTRSSDAGAGSQYMGADTYTIVN